MTGWLVVNGFLQSKKFDELTTLFLRAADETETDLLVKRNDELLVDTELFFCDIPDFVIFWDKDLLLAKMLENQGIRLFNSSETIDICDDKRKTHLALQRAGVRTPRTIMAPMTYDGIGFTSLDFLREVAERIAFPMIVKEAFGSFGEQVYFVPDEEKLHSLVLSRNTTRLLFQEYIAASRGKDVRLQVVGGKVVAAMQRYSTTDFRANVSAGGKMRAYTPTEEETSLALRAAEAVGADFAGVDLLLDENGSCVCEVNSNAHFKNLLDCTGVDTAKEILYYVQKKGGKHGCLADL